MRHIRIYIAFVILSLAMLLLYPREGKFQYDYQKGRPWIYETLVSSFDFPILKTEAEMLQEMDEKSDEIVPYYNYDAKAESSMVERFTSAATEAGAGSDIIKSVISALDDVYRRGVVSDFKGIDVVGKIIFVKRDKKATEVPAEEVFDIEGACDHLESVLVKDANVPDSVITALKVKSFIVPNLIYDENATRMMQRNAVNYISPTKGMVYAGQLIVSEGEIVSADICQVLDSYAAEYKNNFGYTGSSMSLWINHIVMVITLVALLLLTVRFTGHDVLYDTRRLLFILLMAFLAFASVAIVYKVDRNLLCLLPFATLILYISAFYKNSFASATYAVLLLPLLLIPEDGMELYLINLLAGQLVLFTSKKFERGWLQFINAVVIFVAMLVVYLACRAIEGSGILVHLRSRDVLFLALNSLMVVVFYPFVFIFEKMFGFVSYSRLRDLADTNTELLQELQRNAPGTFQHSIQVANLAENAARTIGANYLLARVGALYHDIGKIENPICFVENSAEGLDYHKDLSPEESAQAIIKHVSDGMVLADKHSLPEMVSDFIITHHGRSRVEYFYNVYCNRGGDPENVAPFTYDGRLPQTKEQVILMMADAVEAASRTLKNYTEESVSSLVDNIVSSRLAGDQYSEADITFKEINMVKESFKTYLLQIYHARVVYPKRRK